MILFNFQGSRRSSKNFVKQNINSASIAQIKRAPSLTALDDLRKRKEDGFKNNHKIGQVPRYLEDRKAAWEKSRHKPGSEDASCPPGHVKLAKEEQRETLDMLKTAEQDLMSRLNSLPVRTDTSFLIRRKGNLQTQLQEVGEAIRIFSRPKVFVRNDKLQ